MNLHLIKTATKTACAATILGSAGAFAAPLAAQDNSELKELDARLPGDLVNDPSRIDWQSYGAELEATSVLDESIPGGGAARQFIVKRAAEYIYTAGTNIPLIKSVNRGEAITVGFYARTLDADSDDGKGVVRIRFQQNAEPFPGFGETTLTIGSQWEWYEVTAEAEQKLRKKDGIVAIQFGRTRQTLEIGQAIVVSGADTIAAEGPVTVAAATFKAPKLEMPDGLADIGVLMNSPAQARWRFGGSAGTYTQRDEPEIWMMKATRFSVADAATNLTDLYATVPIQQAITKGDNLTIAIAAKTVSSSAEDAKAVAASRIQGAVPPFEAFASNRFKIGDAWQLIKIKTQAPRDYTPGGSELQLYFGGNQQQVDLGPVYIFKTDN